MEGATSNLKSDGEWIKLGGRGRRGHVLFPFLPCTLTSNFSLCSTREKGEEGIRRGEGLRIGVGNGTGKFSLSQDGKCELKTLWN